MFDHVTIRAADRAASERFYDTVLSALRIEKMTSDERFAEWGDFSIAQAERAAEPTKRLHVAFAASSRAEMDAFWRAGVAAGYADDGAPGPGPCTAPTTTGPSCSIPTATAPKRFATGRRTPAPPSTTSGSGSPTWSRRKRLYELVAGHASFELGDDTPGHSQFVRPHASFSVVAGPPTQNLHMAFPADDDTPATTAPTCSTRMASRRSRGRPA